jgi:phosphoserine phosphatase
MTEEIAKFDDVETQLLTTSAANVVCVDLDGTLIVGDLLVESFVTLFGRNPLRALVALASLRKGKAAFKREIARLVRIDPASLTYRTVILDRLRDLRRQGATIVLATASDAAYARAVAEHLGLFTDVLASDGRTNLAGSNKAAVLVKR